MHDKIGLVLFGYRDGIEVFSSSKLYTSILNRFGKDKIFDCLKLNTTYYRPEIKDYMLSCSKTKDDNGCVYLFIKYKYIKDYSKRNGYFASAVILDNIYIDVREISQLHNISEEQIQPFIDVDQKTIKQFNKNDIDLNACLNTYDIEFFNFTPFNILKNEQVFYKDLNHNDLKYFFNLVYIQEYNSYYKFYTSSSEKDIPLNSNTIPIAEYNNLDLKKHTDKLKKLICQPKKNTKKPEYNDTSEDFNNLYDDDEIKIPLNTISQSLESIHEKYDEIEILRNKILQNLELLDEKFDKHEIFSNKILPILESLIEKTKETTKKPHANNNLHKKTSSHKSILRLFTHIGSGLISSLEIIIFISAIIIFIFFYFFIIIKL